MQFPVVHINEAPQYTCMYNTVTMCRSNNYLKVEQQIDLVLGSDISKSSLSLSLFSDQLLRVGGLPSPPTGLMTLRRSMITTNLCRTEWTPENLALSRSLSLSLSLSSLLCIGDSYFRCMEIPCPEEGWHDWSSNATTSGHCTSRIF